MKQRVSANILFAKKEPKEFVDRMEIKDKVVDACNSMLVNPKTYFKVIDIYGIGGIGKSRLITELKENITDKLSLTKYKVVPVSFEIEGRQQVLQNLVQIRRTFNVCCPIFDYALMTYWDKAGCIEKLEDEFMYTIRSSFLVGLADVATDVTSSAFPILPGVPSIHDIFDCVNSIIQKAQRFAHREYLKSISQMETQELLEKMPFFLGFDIERLTAQENILFVFLCDSYQQSIPYFESQEWLLDFIVEIHRGLFIITGREKLKWDDPQKDILPYHLQGFPEEVARAHLKSYIPKANDAVINEILLSTQCVPLFVDMAIDVYQREYGTHQSIELVYFRDREQLTRRYVHHLPEKWQSLLLAFAVVGIFNRDIFIYFGEELGCPCPTEDYEDFISTSLSNYVETADNLVKLHDVFCTQAVKVLSPAYIKDIWHKYLNYIRARETCRSSSDSSKLLTLFLNLLQRCIDLRLSISIEESEWLLDIFFDIIDTRTFFELSIPNSNCCETLSDIFLLLNAVLHEKANTGETIRLLTAVKDPSRFGRHRKSYDLVMIYAQSLLGQYSKFYAVLEKMELDLIDSDRPYWYYPRIKLYIIDGLLMSGKFRASLQRILDLKNEEHSNDINFQLSRAAGHIYRFNMEVGLAAREYQAELGRCLSSINSRVHLQTNLCEAYCYFEPEQFNALYESTLEEALALDSLKNLGKLYYSKAIMLVTCGKIDKAYAEVQRSLGVNKRDGYQSGELFAYMARAYCDYAKYGRVQRSTHSQIEDLLARNQVYLFFRLPLLLMENNRQGVEALQSKFDWLDFEQTIKQYDVFLNQIHPNHTS